MNPTGLTSTEIIDDNRDPGDEDRSNAFAAFRGAGLAAELDALEDAGSNDATQALIRKLLEGKLK